MSLMYFGDKRLLAPEEYGSVRAPRVNILMFASLITESFALN